MRPILRCLTVLAAVAGVLSACGSSAPAAHAANQSVTMTLGANPARTFILYKPVNLQPGAPLVIVLHGAPSTGAQMQSMTQFDPVADAHGFAVAYPNAIGAGTIQGDWQIGCCNATLRGTGDLRFLSNLIDDLARTEQIDRTRVYVVGFSLGAAMTYRVACELSSKVAGVASVSGFEYLSKPCHPKQPVSVYEIHGTNDYYGGSCGGHSQSDVGCGLGEQGYEPSVQQTNAQWRHADGCSSAFQTFRSGSVTRKLWKQCRGRAAVQLDVIQGGGHCYPQLGSSCGNYNASADIWRFLSGARLNSSVRALR